MVNDEWSQERVIHCPDNDCGGMLLESRYQPELKCSDCDRYFIEDKKFVEVKMGLDKL